MENLRAKIIEKSAVSNFEKLDRLLKSNILVNTGDRSFRNYDLSNVSSAQIEISVQNLLKDIDECFKATKKSQLHECALKTLEAIFGTLQYDLDQLDYMTLWSIRNKGKFRLKEADVAKLVQEEFMHFPKFKFDERDFHQTLMTLKNDGFISLRRKNVLIQENLVCVIELF